MAAESGPVVLPCHGKIASEKESYAADTQPTDHLCKPDLTIFNPADPSFIAWRTAMFTLSKCSKVYMKLSGLFSEMPDSLRQRRAEDIFAGVNAWLAVVLAAFGPSRLMFGSDWPVCTVGVGKEAWLRWRKVVERMAWMASLEEEDQAMLWGGTAKKAYGVEFDEGEEEEEEDEDEDEDDD